MYRDLVYRPEEDSYGTRDLVFRPGVDTTIAETLPYRLGRPHTSINPEVERLREAYDLAPMRPVIENPEEKANMLLKLFINSISGDQLAGLPAPMSQEEFHHEVTKRMDRNKPSVADVLRQKYGIGSFREGINRGIFPGAPQVPGI